MAAATTLIVAGAVASAAAAGYSAYSQNKAAREQAREEKRVAREQAGQIREKGKRVLAAQRAALGASGIKVDEGTGIELQKETQRLTEQDALAVLRGGKARAGLLKSQGKRALVAGGLDMVGTAASAAGGYKAASAASNKAAAVTSQTASKSLASRTQPKYSLLGGTGANKFGL